MGNQIDLPANTPIVHKDGSPTPWFAILLKKVSTTVDGVLAFTGYVEGGALSVDGLEQGITQRVREIARQEIAYNANGTVASVMHKDTTTGAILAEETFSYNANATVDQVIETTPQAVVTQNYVYTGVDLTTIEAAVEAIGLA